MNFRGVIAGTLCALVMGLSAPACASDEASLSDADRTLSTLLADKCSDGNEHFAIYLNSTWGAHKLIEKDSSENAVGVDEQGYEYTASNKHVTVAHCHHVADPIGFKGEMFPSLYALEQHMAELGLQFKDGVAQRLRARRYYLEIPSGLSVSDDMKMQGDVYIMLRFESTSAFAHGAAGCVDHRLVLLYPDRPPRVLAYGLSPEMREEFVRAVTYYKERGRDLGWQLVSNGDVPLRKEAQEGDPDFSLNNARINLMLIYTQILDNYVGSHCLPGSAEGCAEPSWDELVAEVNGTGLFYIKDLGYVK